MSYLIIMALNFRLINTMLIRPVSLKSKLQEEKNKESWCEIRNLKTGKTYYWNSVTSEISWENPFPGSNLYQDIVNENNKLKKSLHKKNNIIRKFQSRNQLAEYNKNNETYGNYYSGRSYGR